MFILVCVIILNTFTPSLPISLPHQAGGKEKIKKPQKKKPKRKNPEEKTDPPPPTKKTMVSLR